MTKRVMRVGDNIPAFWTRDVKGKVVDSEHLGTTYTLMVFLRYAGCPLCNLALYRLTMEYSLLRKNNCEVIAFVQSSGNNIEKNIYGRHDHEPPFSIIPDQDQDIYRLFGVIPDITNASKHLLANASHWLDASYKKGFPQKNLDGSLFIVPALFLVSPAGFINVVNYNANFYDDLTFTPIYEHLTFGGGR